VIDANVVLSGSKITASAGSATGTAGLPGLNVVW
jgi:hypothetical protein